MPSTNKTPNYNLSQYIGTDKPTYLGDYNSDMLKIDTQMQLNAESSSNAVSTANAVKTGLDTIKNSVEEITSGLNEANRNIAANTTLINSVNTVATSANNNANNANTTANENANKLSQNVWTPFTRVTSMTTKFTPVNSSSNIEVSYNPFLQLMIFKGAGKFTENVVNNELLFTLPASIPRPSVRRVIFLFFTAILTTTLDPIPVSVVIDPDGSVKTSIGSSTLTAPVSVNIQNIYLTQGWFN